MRGQVVVRLEGGIKFLRVRSDVRMFKVCMCAIFGEVESPRLLGECLMSIFFAFRISLEIKSQQFLKFLLISIHIFKIIYYQLFKQFQNMLQSQTIVTVWALFTFYLVFTEEIQGLGFPQFSHYVNTYSKQYDEQEQIIRQKYYNQTIKKASQLAISIKNYSIGINKYWDNFPQQESRMVNGVKLSWKLSTSLRKQIPSNSSLQSINWKDKGKVTPVRDQGNLIHGDWIFAYLAYMESYVLIHHNEGFDFSEQQILSCTDSMNDGPQEITLAHQRAQKGIAVEQQFKFQPLDPFRDIPGICDDYVKHGFFFHIKAKIKLSDEELIEYLEQGPLIVAVDPQNWVLYDSGIFECQFTDQLQITHGVLLIGVTEDYWVIKNSWGMGWGEAGYMKITRKKAKNCGIGLYSYVNMESLYCLCLTTLLILLSCLL